jgi:hypothetical protein
MKLFRRVALTAAGLALVGGVLVAGASGRASAFGVQGAGPAELAAERSDAATAGPPGRVTDGIRWEDFRGSGIRWN